MSGYYLNDLAGTTSRKKYSLLDEAETLAVMSKEEVTIDASPSLFFIFDPDVFDKSMCKIKKIKINIYHLLLDRDKFSVSFEKDSIVLPIDQTDDQLYYTNLANDVIEQIRWPALEEIIISDNRVQNEFEVSKLGVKIKYVPA